MREVASRAGVSLGTVSRVLNGHPSVAAELRERVLRAIDDLGYRPNLMARGLRSGRTQSLGLVIPDVTNPFFSAMVLEVEQTASRAGYSVILGNSMESKDAERLYIDLLISRGVDGLLIAPSLRTRSIEVAQGVPVVAIGRPLKGIPSVTIDNRMGAIQAVEHLLGLGHRDIACIAGPRVHSGAVDRHRGYVDAAGPALRAAGIDPADRTRFVAFDYESGYQAASDLLAADPRPTAIFASSDQQAIGALRAAGDAGLDVPNDLSIVGIDNIPLTNLMTPRITTVAMAAMGERGVQVVLDILAGKAASMEERLATTLLVRDSSAPPRSVGASATRRKSSSSETSGGAARPA
jgi:LacI family transcriptional regulator